MRVAAELAGIPGRDVVADHLEAEACRLACRRAADEAKPQDAEGPAADQVHGPDAGEIDASIAQASIEPRQISPR